MENHASKANKPQDGQAPINTPAGFLYNSYKAFIHKYIQKMGRLNLKRSQLKMAEMKIL